MSDHPHPTSRPHGPQPTAAQQRFIRQLALERGISFTPPRTLHEASRLIDELRRRTPDSRADVRRDRRAIKDALARSGGAATVRDFELDGYGSTATWKEVHS